MPDKPVDALLLDLQNPAVFVKRTAIMQLEKKKASQAVPHLLTLLKDQEASIRSCAAWALGQLGDEECHEKALLALLEDMDSAVRRSAAIGLGQMGKHTALPRLIQLSVDADRYVRQAAVEAVASIEQRVTAS
jgi:HEAT repeat protein